MHGNGVQINGMEKYIIYKKLPGFDVGWADVTYVKITFVSYCYLITWCIIQYRVKII